MLSVDVRDFKAQVSSVHLDQDGRAWLTVMWRVMTGQYIDVMLTAEQAEALAAELVQGVNERMWYVGGEIVHVAADVGKRRAYCHACGGVGIHMRSHNGVAAGSMIGAPVSAAQELNGESAAPQSADVDLDAETDTEELDVSDVGSHPGAVIREY